MRCEIAAGLDLLDPEACRMFLIRRWHPDGPRCPECGVSLGGRQAETFIAGGRVHCNDCSRWFTCRTGTPVARSTADDRQIVLFAMLTAAECSVPVIAEACRLSADTVRIWQRRSELTT